MQSKKLIFISFFSSAAILLPIFSTSCASGGNIVIDNTYFRFIRERSFSIQAVGGNFTDSGTGWILSKKTGGNLYEYWLATCWHVVDQMVQDGATAFYYGDEMDNNADNRTAFAKFQYENYTNFTWDHTYDSSHDNFGIDLSIVDVDFGNSANIPLPILDKLQNLNLTNSEYGYINQFNTTPTNDFFYVAGFTAQPKIKATTWTTGIFGSHKITNIGKNQKTAHHWGANNQNYDSTSPYDLSNEKGHSGFGGGASGSLAIDDHYRVAGIFWGQQNSHNMLSILKWNDYSFVDNYLS
ncbi:MAG: hypothetical protein LBT17_01080 [Mycoplasmataceae bacterium]|nr:hypothetical protein [Mycoplasmataceae bacterium]